MPGDGRELPGPPVLLDDDGGQAVRCPGDLDLLLRRVGGVVATEHEHFVGVLVVGDEDLPVALARQRQQSEEVVVVAELLRLRLGGLVLRVEGGRTAQDGLAPADDDVLRVAVRDGHGVGGVRRDGLEAQAARAAGGVAGAGRGGGGRLGGARLRGGDGGGGADRGGRGDDGRGAHHRTAAEGVGDDITDIWVGSGVRHLVETGVSTPETAGQGCSATMMRVVVDADDRQLNTHGSWYSPCFPLNAAWGTVEARLCGSGAFE